MVFESLTGWYRPRRSPNSGNAFEPASVFRLLIQAPIKVLLYTVFHFFNYLRSAPTPSEPPIRVVCISDTHDQFPEDIPEGDILIHAGDLTNAGSVADIQRQADRLASLPHKEIIVIAGNHDTYLDPRTRPSLSEEQRLGEVNWKRIHYLQHRGLSLTITVEPCHSDGESAQLLNGPQHRKVKIYGAPQIPACGPVSVHAFQYERGRDAWSETVPEDTDILITHTPPKYHLDLSLSSALGCEHLLAEVRRVKPTLHVFGHVHWGAGQTVVWWDNCHDSFTKGMAIQSTWSHDVLSLRLWWNVIRVAYRGLMGLIWDKVWGGQGPHTVMVNAAQMHGNTGRIGNRVQVVDM